MAQPPDWQQRIKSDPAVHHGDPCIAGTRVPISAIVGCIAEGDTWDQVLASYPGLHADDIRAALLHAAEAVNHFDMIPAAE